MNPLFKKICVVGLGYIGLPTAAMFASRKLQVVGVDINKCAVDTINVGDIHIVEPDLDVLVRTVVSEGLLRAATRPEPADAFLIAVPTPFTGKNHDPDLSFIEAATLSIAPMLKAGDLVILESTCPVGATESMADWLASARPDLTFPQTHGEQSDIRVAHCPERVLPGRVLQELVSNDRVIGGFTDACSRAAAALYQVFVEGECVFASGPRVAEMAKLTENSFRDVNIAFANELSLISDRLGVDVWELISLANRHPRVDILRPGAGVGGHCIAVDPWFIVSAAPDIARVIKAAREVNGSKPQWVADKAQEMITRLNSEKGCDTSGQSTVSVACYGLAFKPDIDDLRESPAVEVASRLLKADTVELLVVEPHISQLPETLNSATLVTAESAIASADIHVLLVGHSQFSSLSLPNSGYVIDAVGLLTNTHTR